MRIVYVSLRRLAPGSVIETEAQLVIQPRELMPDFRTVGTVKESLSGDAEIDTWREEDRWSVDTGWISRGTEWLKWQEFFASTSRGETFEFDPISIAADTEIAPRTCRMETRDFKPTADNAGNISYRFVVREV